MKNYLEFIKEGQTVFLGDTDSGFYTNKYSKRGYKGSYTKSISYLNNKIKNYIDTVYGPYGYKYGDNSDININGLVINGEYIDKMVNNYTIFKRFIKDFSINTEDEFYEKIVDSFDNVYHYEGDFFKRNSLPILINTTRKGNINEKKSLEKFIKVISDKGIDITIQKPSIEEDVKGVDGKFTHNGRSYTIQVKPFSSINIKDGVVYAKSDGSLSLGVNYLILYKGEDYIILKNPSNNKIIIDGSNFVYNQGNILYTDV